MPNRIALLAGGALAVLLAADTVGWWWVTQRMAAETTAWREQANAAGYAVQFGPATRGGWPLSATLTMPDVTAATDPAGSAAWHADGARLEYSPFDPFNVSVVLLGPQTVRLRGYVAAILTAQRLDVVVPLRSGQASGLQVDGRGLSLPSVLEAARVTMRVASGAVDLVASGVTLPGKLPFDGVLNRLEVQARSTLPIPDFADPAAAVAAWQKAGGRAVIQHAALRWGPLDVEAAGDFGLDAALQPAGTASLHLAGYAEALDALVRAGTVSRNQARVFTAVLGLMARPNAAGSPEAELPLILSDGLLRLGGMPLLRVPPVAWP